MSPRKVHPKMAPFLAAAKRKFYIGAGARTSGRNICISKYIKAATEKKTFAEVAWGGGGGFGRCAKSPTQTRQPVSKSSSPENSKPFARTRAPCIFFYLLCLGFAFPFRVCFCFRSWPWIFLNVLDPCNAQP